MTTAVTSELFSTLDELWNVLVTAVRGMAVTAKYLVRPQEIVTRQYPHERPVIATNSRGRLVNAMPRCIVCELCAKVCPTNCIAMTWETASDKKRICHTFDIDMTICLYCGLCTEVCPDTTKNELGEKCLTMNGGYEYSSDRKESIGFYFKATDQELVDSRRAADVHAAELAAKAAAKKVVPPPDPPS